MPLVRWISQVLGLKIQRCPPGSTGIDAFRDMKLLVAGKDLPLVFDVGANVGQSVRRFKEILPSAEIHSFEPSPSTYAQLARNVHRYTDVYVNNCGLGAEAGAGVLLENVHSDMTSFLRPGRLAWGHISQEISVPIATIDEYCADRRLGPINILKIDTQGFDFEVLKGAGEVLRGGRIQMVYLEIIFSAMYENLPPYDEVFQFMRNNGFKLVSIYEIKYQEGLASWSDALFLNPTFTE